MNKIKTSQIRDHVHAKIVFQIKDQVSNYVYDQVKDQVSLGLRSGMLGIKLILSRQFRNVQT